MARFTWGDTVRVNDDVGGARAGHLAEVVAITPVENEHQATHYGVPMGTTMYQVEFGNGDAVEFPEYALDAGPDFYLASTEGYDLDVPRRCWRLERLRTRERDDLLLVRIEPPLVGQKYGLGGRDVDVVVLAPRHVGGSLFPVTEWPVYVHVARLRVEPPDDGKEVRVEDLDLIAWAELYETEHDAREKTDA